MNAPRTGPAGAPRGGTEERGDETRKMTAMNAWLDDVCAELGVDRALLSAVTPPMLRLISEVAHGPSRPGAPLTAFVVGLAAARAAGDAQEQRAAAVVSRVEAVSALVARWTERQAGDAGPGAVPTAEQGASRPDGAR
ncbi:hypothetical protein KZX45_19225 [Georgenia sp. EYE_87]|uniref:DUF6457 domain-containing protein n=1 Tax=Georgenia sp. EYE_87 TaxID=2853448 RepID=UPI0020034816|nr:DUF6457 domain-containing protein [Georgenia sp. EYE_87]MCK6212675.1 hypothetical protein [Georgenia sp. EYE_87]